MPSGDSQGDSMKYIINYTDSSREQSYDTLEQATAAVIAEFGSDTVVSHNSDLDGFGDRTLFWANEEDAQDDDGARVLGSIRKAG